MIQQMILNGIIAGGIYVLIAIGFTIIYRTVRFFHFAHGIVYTAGAYFTYSLFTSFHFSFPISFFLSIFLASLLGIVIDRVVYYPLRLKNASNLIFLIASFGVFIFLQNLIALIYGSQILTLRTGPIREGYHILGAVITPIQILILTVLIILVFLLWFFIKQTKFGKAMRAVSDDPLAANVVGINPERIIIISFALGSLLAGVAGILISLETNLEPTMGFIPLLKGVIASIIGGIGSIPGSVLGGFFLGLVENLGIWKISASWKDLIAFVILIIFLLFKPRGFLGIKTEKEIT